MPPIGNFARQNESEVNHKPYKKKASTAYSFGDLVALDSDGYLIKAIETTPASDIVGVIQETIASTDSDYASTREVLVDVVDKDNDGSWFAAKVGNGSAAQTDVGEACDLTSGGQVNVSASSVKVVKVQRVLSATLVLVSFLSTDLDVS
jgi:hypothetical protein